MPNKKRARQEEQEAKIDNNPLPEELQLVPIPSVPLLMWDENRKPTHSTFSNRNLTVEKTGHMVWNCGVIGNVVVDKFTVRIETDVKGSGGATIGFTTGDGWYRNRDNGDNNGWFISVYDGSLSGIGTSKAKTTPYSSEIKNGDYLTVIREGNTIRFEKNKIDLGICQGFTNIPNHSLFPAVNIALTKISVTIVNNY